MSLTLETSDTGYNEQDELIDIKIVTHYTIEKGGYADDGKMDDEYRVLKIWYGDVRYSSLYELKQDFPDAAMEIEQCLDNEIENQ